MRMPFLPDNGRVNCMCQRAWLIPPSCLGFSLCSQKDNLAVCLQNAAVLHPVKCPSFKLLAEHQPSFIMSAAIHGTATASLFPEDQPALLFEGKQIYAEIAAALGLLFHPEASQIPFRVLQRGFLFVP